MERRAHPRRRADAAAVVSSGRREHARAASGHAARLDQDLGRERARVRTAKEEVATLTAGNKERQAELSALKAQWRELQDRKREELAAKADSYDALERQHDEMRTEAEARAKEARRLAGELEVEKEAHMQRHSGGPYATAAERGQLEAILLEARQMQQYAEAQQGEAAALAARSRKACGAADGAARAGGVDRIERRVDERARRCARSSSSRSLCGVERPHRGSSSCAVELRASGGPRGGARAAR